MRIAQASDLHLEYGTIELKNTGDADVLILAGDICIAKDLEFINDPTATAASRANRYMEFFAQVSEEFPQVIYILGNHEHYDGDFKFTLYILKNLLAKFPNIRVLEKETYELDDVTFICATLWTDMNKGCPNTLLAIKNMMHDFQCIKNSNNMVAHKIPVYNDNDTNSITSGDMEVREPNHYDYDVRPGKFSPEDAMDEHQASLNYIKHVVANKRNEKYVVVTHHCPSELSSAPKWAAHRELNGGFYSELGDYIVDQPDIKLWVHGHTHDPFDYVIGETRVVCNPRGYIGNEKRAETYELVYIDV